MNNPYSSIEFNSYVPGLPATAQPYPQLTTPCYFHKQWKNISVMNESK